MAKSPIPLQAEAPPQQQEAKILPEGSQEEQQHNIEVKEWVEPDPVKITNPEPGKRYRWLNKDRIAREQHTRRWDITTNPDVRLADPYLKALRDKDVPQGTSSCDRTTQVGTMILAEMPEELAQSRDKHVAEKAATAVDRVMKDDKERSEMAYEAFRRMGADPSDARSLVRMMGGVRIMNPDRNPDKGRWI